MSDGAASRRAVVVPGGMYGPHTPLLSYAAEAAEARNADVWPVEWTHPRDAAGLQDSARGPWVLRHVTGPLAKATRGRASSDTLIIGKSLGAFAAPLAAAHGLPAIWLTPDLRSIDLVEALRQAQAPVLLVGGTADLMWSGQIARSVTPHLLEVEGADHGMHLPGPLAASAAVLGQVATAVETFLDAVVWPQ